MTQRAHTTRGFTLVELLIVIAIIGMLIGILLPVLAMARESAIGATCLANQSQLVTAVHAYAADNKGYIPYGPEEPDGGQSSATDDLYIVNGMVTSLISERSGLPVGAGIMIDNYLSDVPEALFCPGADQETNVKLAIERVGTSESISSYIYRHSSNDFDDLYNFQIFKKPMRGPLQIDRLGKNRNGDDVSALFIDNNYILPPGFYADLFLRSNHEQRYVNIAYADGHAEQRDNADERYSANIVGTDIGNSIKKMLEVMEYADVPE